MKEDIRHNLIELRGRIADACEKYHRDKDNITVVAVTKKWPVSVVRAAVAAGLHDIGENRIQEAEPKITELGPIARFHLIGHLQSNKVPKAVALFDVIQSVDSLDLAEEISRRASKLGRTMDCLLQVNSSGEESKHGTSPESALGLIEQISKLPAISLTGVMTIGPLTDDEDRIRAAFRTCREIFQRGQAIAGERFDTLSMGMSDD
ncbi:MAG: YggS family pyridoxal phosphate-dependent enzyme, partial [candidate division Zixibacteria bacterium]|nr:YggS family pyridoxal phosphate-dependent enzyme [candidate division Zixibacteria bacterium]